MLSSFGFTNRRRTSKCVSCGCVWLLVLVVVQQCGGDESDVIYTTPNLDLSYNSSTETNGKAMEQLYYVTNFFIDLIVKEDAYPEDLFEDENGKFTTAKLSSDWISLVRHYAGVVSVAALGLLFVVLMPLVALIFCCCRCAGRCGGRIQPVEKRRDPCRRVTHGIFLSGVAIIILFGVVCAFVTNEYMEDGIKNLPSKLSVAVSDTNLYLNNTVVELNYLLVDNFFQLRGFLVDDLNSAAAFVMDHLKNNTPLKILQDLLSLCDGFQLITEDVNKINNLTIILQQEAKHVTNELSSIESDLLKMLNKCLEMAVCNSTAEKVKATQNPADFSQLPNITEQLSGLGNFSEIEAEILKGEENYKKIRDRINETISTYSPNVTATLDEAGNSIKKKSNEINIVMSNMTHLIDRESKPVLKDLDYLIKEYSKFRYYTDIAVSSVMLLILLCLTLGLFYGFCGKRPDGGYDEDCCNKATGASFLSLGVYVMFWFSAVLMLVTLVHFLLGVAAEKGICKTLEHPESSQLLALLNKEDRLKISYIVGNTSVDLNISQIISSCHANESIYNVLQVSKALNISEILEYPENFKIKDKIDDLKNTINLTVGFELMKDSTKEQLKELGKTSLNLTSLNDIISSFDRNNSSLIDLADTLDSTADKIVGDEHKGTQESLRNDAKQLRALHKDHILPMKDIAIELNETAYDLEEKMKFNYSSVSEAVDKILEDIDRAQDYIENNITAEMSKKVSEFTNNTLEKVYGYLRHVVHHMTTEVGSCEPLSRVYNASRVATCNDILDPFNGFWASIGWCLVLFIPAIIMGVKLNALYRKSESYHAAIPDTEYLYDAYADRDNIPLANGPDKKNHHRRYNETYDNSSGYMGDYSSHMGRGDRERRDRGGSAYHPEDARFNDMAPKHWDYSNGALPRYHSPPLSTEYERPPPYYYPGPGLDNGSIKSKKEKKTKGKSADDASPKGRGEKYYTFSGLPKLTMDMLGSIKRRVSTAPRTKLTMDSFKGLPRLSFGSFKLSHPQPPRLSEQA